METSNAKKILLDIFGYHSFRSNQEDIINNTIKGNDSLVFMATGGGKSLCYQIPGIARDGICIVISPLISLMKDQVDSLKNNGVSAYYLNSETSEADIKNIDLELKNNTLKFLYVSPERLLLPSFFSLIYKHKISLFTIDEAHCISQWGHDFRPSYLNIKEFLNFFPEVPKIALTATANTETREDIIKQLNLKNAKIFSSSFNRKNIEINIINKQKNANSQILDILKINQNESAIVFCKTQKETIELSQFLNENNINSTYYHAGLTKEEKNINQDKFLNDETRVIAATIAFGMGIDKSNIRLVIHKSLPNSIESYYQEIGRAGRDGLDSQAILLYSQKDFKKINSSIILDMKNLKDDKNKLKQLFNKQHKLNLINAVCESSTCRRQTILRCLGEEYNETCNNCDRCNNPVDTYDATENTKIILKSILSLNEQFGQNHLINFITGLITNNITKYKHNIIKEFSSGSHLNKEYLETIFRQLIVDNYINISKNGILSLTKNGHLVLLNKKTVLLNSFKTIKENKITTKKNNLPSLNQNIIRYIIEYRNKLSKQKNTYPHNILDDRLIENIVSYMPTNISDLSKIDGFSENKIKEFGQNIIDIINKEKTSKSKDTIFELDLFS